MQSRSSYRLGNEDDSARRIIRDTLASIGVSHPRDGDATEEDKRTVRVLNRLVNGDWLTWSELRVAESALDRHAKICEEQSTEEYWEAKLPKQPTGKPALVPTGGGVPLAAPGHDFGKVLAETRKFQAAEAQNARMALVECMYGKDQTDA